ncbi:MAG: hypothetical protein M1401_12080 [Chloroflexi bacterium]|nr:hypothetical protein [Chloroflexota bacterium]
MEIVRLDLENRAQVKEWLELPFRIYRDSPEWVPTMDSDARLVLDRRRYPFYEHSEAAFFLARAGDRVVGRVAAIDHRPFNTVHKERTAFFYLFESENDREVAGVLLNAAAAWAKERGLERLIGPKGFTSLDGMGLLVKGFEHRPAVGIPYNHPYYEDLVLAAGFDALDDDVSGFLSSQAKVPARLHELAERVKNRRGLSVPLFTRKSELRTWIPRIRDLYNNSLGLNWDQAPVSEAEIKLLGEQLLAIADPRLIKLVLKGDEPVGFIFAYPDPSAAIQRTKGRLWPFGWIDLLLELRRTRWLNVNGMGILPEYQGLGGTVLLMSELAKAISGGRWEHVEAVQISVHNTKMQRAMEDLGIDFCKVHRLYQRPL